MKWVHQTYDNGKGQEVSKRMLCYRARELAKNAGVEFVASYSWADRFANRQRNSNLPLSFNKSVAKTNLEQGSNDEPNQQCFVSPEIVHAKSGNVHISPWQKAAVPVYNDGEDCPGDSEESDATIEFESEKSSELECNDSDAISEQIPGLKDSLIHDDGQETKEVESESSNDAQKKTSSIPMATSGTAASDTATTEYHVEYTYLCDAEKIVQDIVTREVSNIECSLPSDQRLKKDQSTCGGHVIYKKDKCKGTGSTKISPDSGKSQGSTILVNEQDFAILAGTSQEGSSDFDCNTDLTTQAAPLKKNHPQSASYKLSVLRYAQMFDEHSAEDFFSLPEGCVRKWKQEEAKIMSSCIKNKRSLPREDITMFPDVEKVLVEWIFDLHKREPHMEITPKMICAKAKYWADQAGIPAEKFSGSSSWVTRFLSRYKHFDLPVKRQKRRASKSPTHSDEDEPGMQKLVDQDDHETGEENAKQSVGHDSGHIQEQKVTTAWPTHGNTIAAGDSKGQTASCDSVDKVQRDGQEPAQKELGMETTIASSEEQHREKAPSSSGWCDHRSKRRGYTAGFKLEVVKYAEKHGNRKTGRHYLVPEKNVRRWRRNKATLETLPKGKKCLGGSQPSMPEIEEKMLRWILLQYSEGHGKYVTLKMIRDRANQAIREAGMEAKFSANGNWAARFLERYKAFDLPVKRRRPYMYKKRTTTKKATDDQAMKDTCTLIDGD